MGHSEGSPEREVNSSTDLPKEDRKISNKQPNPTIKEVEKRQQIKPRMSRRKEKKSRSGHN